MISLSIILLFIIYIGITLSATCDHEACVHVKNECPFTLYIQRDHIDGENINKPDHVTPLESNEEIVLDITDWKNSEGGDRLYGWWQDPVVQDLDPLTYREKVEINWYCYNEKKMCYNPTSVDYFGLPVQIGPYNQADCPEVGFTGQNTINIEDISSDCPTEYVSTEPAGVCKAPYHVCISDPSHSICGELNDGLDQCKSDEICPQSVTSTELWGCGAPWMSTKPEICAALHRGVYGADNENDPATFYKNIPYSSYSKWIHSNDVKQYAFSYDDVAEQGGYKECSTNFLTVTFCASSSQSDK